MQCAVGAHFRDLQNYFFVKCESSFLFVIRFDSVKRDLKYIFRVNPD